MAIDTRDKRASSLAGGLMALLVLPEPGAIEAADRPHLAALYRGFASPSPSTRRFPTKFEVDVEMVQGDDELPTFYASVEDM